MVKYFDFVRKIKRGLKNPQEFVSEASFGFIEGYFVISLMVLALFTGISIWLGFFNDIVFFKITTFFFGLLFVSVFIVFQMLKRFTERVSKKITHHMRNRLQKKDTVIDVDVVVTEEEETRKKYE